MTERLWHLAIQGMIEAASGALDRQVRGAAFGFLAEQTRLHGETLSWARLLQGFDFQGRRVPLVSQPGIFKPAILPEVPLTIRTAPWVWTGLLHEEPSDGERVQRAQAVWPHGTTTRRGRTAKAPVAGLGAPAPPHRGGPCRRVGEDEQHGAFLEMLGDRVACPFTALVVGEEVDVRGFNWAGGAPHEIVALCRRKGRTYRVNATALQWAGRRPAGAEWFDAYGAWLKGMW